MTGKNRRWPPKSNGSASQSSSHEGASQAELIIAPPPAEPTTKELPAESTVNNPVADLIIKDHPAKATPDDSPAESTVNNPVPDLTIKGHPTSNNPLAELTTKELPAESTVNNPVPDLTIKGHPTSDDPLEEPIKDLPDEPTVEEIRESKANRLFKWIQKTQIFEDDDLERFRSQRISGSRFLALAGNVEIFESKFELPYGPSADFADLASKLKRGETADIIRKRKAQDTSTEPSAKRRHGNTPADIARDLRDRLLKENRDPGKLRDQLSNPKVMTRLPFPFPGQFKPTGRFKVVHGNWNYMGREYFPTLLGMVTKWRASETQNLSLYGTIGYGKSLF